MTVALPADTPRELKDRIEAERRGSPFLVYRDGEGQQVIRELTGDRLSVGRSETADLSLAFDDKVSRVHAQLECVDEDWVIVDDGLSRNGSFVNQERIVGRRRLRDGDVLRFGGATLLFRSPAQAAEETVPSKDGPETLQVSGAQRRVLLALCRPVLESSDPGALATNKQIAAELVVGVDAVKANLRTLFERFGVADLPQNQKRIRLAELALRSGTISPRDLRHPS
ncbi:MAG: FHA domain-containing protein [Solirubrobacterales bacterium]